LACEDPSEKDYLYFFENVSRLVMSEQVDRYELYLEVGGADDEELDQYSRDLQRELNELEDVTHLEQITTGKAPEGSRAIDLVLVGGVALALKQAGVFDAVVAVLKAWIDVGNRRKEKRKVIIKRPDHSVLEFDGYSLKEITRVDKVPNPSVKN
jgi:hypothetical protein